MKRIQIAWLSLMTSMIFSAVAAGDEYLDAPVPPGSPPSQAVRGSDGVGSAPSGGQADLSLAEASDPDAGRFWGRAEYNFVWLRGSHLPPLVTTSPPGTPLADQPGALGRPGTTILEGDANVNGGLRSGAQFTLGCWLDEDRDWGMEGTFFLTDALGHHFVAGSDGTDIIARPFTNALTGDADAELVSFPGVIKGTVAVDATSSPLYSANWLLRRKLWREGSGEVSLLGGYRFLSFADDLRIREDLESLDPATLGTIIVVQDHFGTRNQFHGGEIGLETRVSSGNLSLAILAALSVGNLHRSVTIDGSTEVTAPGLPPVTNPGGLLALSSNSGNYLSDELVLVPEIGFTLGLQLNPRWRATAGYNLMLLPGVVRPGDQIDLNVNPNFRSPDIASEVPGISRVARW